MIGQNSNNKATGYTAKACDAGIPISGRTGDTGTYEIIKTLADGTIAGFPSPLNAPIYSGTNLSFFAVPGGLPPANTYLGSAVAAFAVTENGQYLVNPVFIYPGATGGGISFVLYKTTTTLDAYISTLPPFNAYAPTMADITTGLFGYWHNSTSQNFGTNLMFAYNRNNALSVNLTNGLYNIAAITDGATNITPGVAAIGFDEFTKIG